MKFWISVAIVLVVIILLLAGCQKSFLKIFSTDPNKPVAEASGKAADVLAVQLAKEREQNQKLNTTAQQNTTWFCRTLYGVGVLCIIGGIALAWLYSLKTGIGVAATGVIIFMVARLLQQYLPVIILITLVLTVIAGGWYIYKYHSTIFKINAKADK
jgi:hypothetical protein